MSADPELKDTAKGATPTENDTSQKLSHWELEWSDVQRIRESLKLTLPQRLLAAQDLMHQALRIRAKNDHRTPD